MAWHRLVFSEWLEVAVVTGVDPMFGTVGGVAWMQRLVDGTVVKYLNEKDMPQAGPCANASLGVFRLECHGMAEAKASNVAW